MLEKLKKYFSVKSNWAYIIPFFALVVVYFIGFFNVDFSYTAIGGLFLFISIENFLKSIGYFEDMKDSSKDNKMHLEDISGKLNTSIEALQSIIKSMDKVDSKNLTEQIINLRIEKDNLEKKLAFISGIAIRKSDIFIGKMNEMLFNAKKEVIVYGGSMSQIIASDDVVIDIAKNKNIKFRLLALNVENPDVLSAYHKMKEIDNNIAENLSHLDRFNRKNIEIRICDSLPTAYFCAIDINEQNGCIKVSHFLPDVLSELDYPLVELSRSNEEWYNIYRQQIESLWDKSTPLKH